MSLFVISLIKNNNRVEPIESKYFNILIVFNVYVRFKLSSEGN